MSQAGSYNGGGSPLPDIETLTGNTGGPVSPDAAFNIDIIGADGLTVAGNPGTYTLTISPEAGNFVRTLTGDVGGAVGPDLLDNINIVGTDGITVTGNPGTNTLTIAGSAGSFLGVKITKYTASGVFQKDPRTILIRVIVWSGGGGGGSGRQGASGAASGGTGAGSGWVIHNQYFASQCADTETVTIGAGGIGAASQVSANSDGFLGGTGGISSIGNVYAQLGTPVGPTLANFLGNGGNGGRSIGTPYNAQNQNYFSDLYNYYGEEGGNNGTAGPGEGTITNGDDAFSILGSERALEFSFMPGAGAGGAGASSVSDYLGGKGNDNYAYGQWSGGLGYQTDLELTNAGGARGTVASVNGGDGSDMIQYTGAALIPSTGGGSGAWNSGLSLSGNGGNGGIPGSGAGGGAGSVNGSPSGAGGDGGRGEVWVIEVFGSLTN